MNYQTIKYIGLMLLFSVLLAGAFKLLTPAPAGPVIVGNVVPAENSSGSQMAKASSFQKPYAEKKQNLDSRRVDDPPDTIVEPLNLTTNAEDFLSQIRQWARQDPESALIWGKQQPDNAQRNEALTDACFQIAQTDPERAVNLAEQFDLSKDAVLKNLAQQWAASDLATAYKWIIAQPADERRVALVTGTAFVWSQREPLAAAQFVVQQMPAGPTQDEAVMMVLHQWALVDAAGAGSWANQFPAGPLRSRALNELNGITTYEQAAK